MFVATTKSHFYADGSWDKMALLYRLKRSSQQNTFNMPAVGNFDNAREIDFSTISAKAQSEAEEATRPGNRFGWLQ